MGFIQTQKKRLLSKIQQYTRSLFYRFIFGNHIPFSHKLGHIVTRWEKQQRKGDIPVPQEIWETQYLGGKWNYMKGLKELSRYSVVIGYMAHLKPRGAVLDVGCGEGILFEKHRPYEYARYLGIDISGIAIERLSKLQDESTTFIRADAEVFKPTELYDVIIFNESLYYFHDPLSVIEKYFRSLKQGGIVIISTFTASSRAMGILRQIKAKYVLIDETHTTQKSSSWICTVHGMVE